MFRKLCGIIHTPKYIYYYVYVCVNSKASGSVFMLTPEENLHAYAYWTINVNGKY